MKTERRQFRITFTEPILGTSPRNTEIYSDYIGSKAPDAATMEQEIEALGADTVEERGMTVFPRDPAGNPILWDYQVKGFFKDSCGMLARLKGKTESAKLKAFRKIIDGLIFVYPRQIALTCGELRVCQRPGGALLQRGADRRDPGGDRDRVLRSGAVACRRGVAGLRRGQRDRPMAEQRQGPLHLGGAEMKKIKDIAGGLLVVAGFLFFGSGMAECCILKLLEALGL